jgi:hypothetical protein
MTRVGGDLINLDHLDPFLRPRYKPFIGGSQRTFDLSDGKPDLGKVRPYFSEQQHKQ